MSSIPEGTICERHKWADGESRKPATELWDNEYLCDECYERLMEFMD